MYMAHVCFMSVICGNVCCVVGVVEDEVFFSLGVLKYVVCFCRRCNYLLF